MRLAQILVLIIFGIGGLFLGDKIGPLSGLVYDWDVGMYYEFARAVRLFHGIVMGACATLPMLIIGRLFKVTDLQILVISLVLIVTYHLLTFARTGELFSIYPFVALPMLAAPFVVGSLSSLGAVHLAQQVGALVRGCKAP